MKVLSVVPEGNLDEEADSCSFRKDNLLYSGYKFGKKKLAKDIIIERDD